MMDIRWKHLDIDNVVEHVFFAAWLGEVGNGGEHVEVGIENSAAVQEAEHAVTATHVD